MSAVIDMYGLGLTRIVEILNEDEGAGEVKQQLVDDGVVASLLLIHDLYPVPIEERVTEALDDVRPYMESHGGNVELVSLEDGVVRLRLEGSCDGCPASSSTLELAIKTALEEAAPDLLGIEVEGIEQDLLDPVEVTGTPLPVVQAGGSNGSAGIPAPAGASGLARPQRPGGRPGGGRADQDRGRWHADRGGQGRGLAARLPRLMPELRGVDRGRGAR